MSEKLRTEIAEILIQWHRYNHNRKSTTGTLAEVLGVELVVLQLHQRGFNSTLGEAVAVLEELESKGCIRLTNDVDAKGKIRVESVVGINPAALRLVSA